MATASWVFTFTLLMFTCHLSSTAADWKLVLTHSNDLWFQLDEVHSNDQPCFKPLPPPTTTTTTTEATTTTAATTTTTETTTTPPTTTETSTTTPTTPATNTIVSPGNKEPRRRRANDDGSCYGGVARHLTAINKFKNESVAAGSVYLNLNSGGMLGGNIWFPILGTDPASESMKELAYQAVGIGYRDFDEGVASTVAYLTKLKEYNVPVVCANMDTSNETTMNGLYTKSTVLEVLGKKIGVIGFLGTDAEDLADAGKIRFTDEVEAINSEIRNLTSQGINLIIALGNVGYDRGMEILAKTPDVDIMINGGGPNRFLYNGVTAPLGEKVSGSYPTLVNGNLLVQTSRYGKYMGLLNVSVSDDGKIVKSDGNNPVLLEDTNFTPDPELQLKVDDWERQVVIQADEQIGSTKIALTTERRVCWYRECNMANLMADAARWYVDTRANATAGAPWSQSVAAAVWHAGSIVALNDQPALKPGPILFGDILYSFPYANTLAVATMTGAQVKQLLETSVQYYNDSSVASQGEFLQVSGMRVSYAMYEKSGERVSKIIIRDTNSEQGEWSELNAGSVYRIVMPSFVARGGSRFDFMSADNIAHEDLSIRDEIALKSFINFTSPLTYGVDGRITFLTAPLPEPTPEPAPIPVCPSYDKTGTVFLTIFLTILFMGLIYLAYLYLYPKLMRHRSGSLASLVR